MDIPLNAVGVAQAHAAAATFRGHDIRSIVSSPLSRARDTAKAVAQVLGLQVETEDALREVSFGAQEGQPMQDGSWFEDWISGKLTPEDGESFLELRARAVQGITRALTRQGPVLVVAHGALFRALRAEMGLEGNIRTPNALPLFCEPGEPWTLTAGLEPAA